MIFTNVVKPTHLCNLACTYCYNDDVRDPIMRPETLERVITETFAYVRDHFSTRLVNFIWHGGEPMIVGLDFFRLAVDLQQKHAGDIRCDNSIQTNGTLIDNDWIDFLREQHFGVSISIDGPADLHNRARVDRMGRGSFDRVEKAIQRVQNAGLPLGVCLVISRANAAHADEIYDFLAERKLRFNIIPLNRSGAARSNFGDLGLAAEEYAEPWIRMYDRWFDGDQDYVYCSDFVFKTRAIIAGRPADCIGLEQCSETNISVDPIGDVYPCASLSGTLDTCYGNLVTSTLEEVLSGPIANRYRQRPTDEQCAVCAWQHVCHGGCQARAYKFFGDNERRDYYCPSLFRIYEHVAERVSKQLGSTFEPHTHPMNLVGSRATPMEFLSLTDISDSRRVTK